MCSSDLGQVTVVNGLGSRIKRLVVVDLNGTSYSATTPVEPGASVRLAASGGGFARSDSGSRFVPSLDLLRIKDWLTAIGELAVMPAEGLTPGSYLAVLEDTAFVPDALPNIRDHIRTQVVIGLYEAPVASKSATRPATNPASP